MCFHKGYGLTESSGGVFRSIDQEESSRHGSTGKMSWSFKARIVDPETGESLAPCKEGELWIRGPTVMKGTSNIPKFNAIMTNVCLVLCLREFDALMVDSQVMSAILKRLLLL